MKRKYLFGSGVLEIPVPRWAGPLLLSPSWVADGDGETCVEEFNSSLHSSEV